MSGAPDLGDPKDFREPLPADPPRAFDELPRVLASAASFGLLVDPTGRVVASTGAVPPVPLPPDLTDLLAAHEGGRLLAPGPGAGAGPDGDAGPLHWISAYPLEGAGLEGLRLVLVREVTGRSTPVGGHQPVVVADVGVCLADPRQPDAPLVWVSSSFTSVTGYAVDQALGRNCRFLQGPSTDPVDVGAVRTAVDAGNRVTVVLLNHRRDGSAFWNQLTVEPLTDPVGTTVALLGIQADVTERVESGRDLNAAHAAERSSHAAERRAVRVADAVRAQQSMLAEASTLLTATLDVDEALDRLVSLVVPQLADWATITLLDQDGQPRVSAVHHRDGLRQVINEYASLQAQNLTEGSAQGRVLRTGEPVLVERFPADYATRVGIDPRMVELCEVLGLHSSVVVPLTARRRILGTLALLTGRSERVYTAADVEVISDLGRRAALALDNARHYQREHRVAETLQRSLLPELPDLPDVEFAVRYVAGGTEASVGGDFYDVIDLPDGSVGLAIGDVVGHDLQAAAEMGQLRGLLRACAWDGAEQRTGDPAVVVARLDRLMQGLRVAAMATLIYVVLERPAAGGRGWTARYADAGHPHALLRAPDGSVSLLDAADGVLLGVTLELARASAAVRMEPGSVLLLYTDGLIERRGEHLDDSVAALRAAIETLPPGASPEHVCSAAITHAGTVLADDVAVLAVRPV